MYVHKYGQEKLSSVTKSINFRINASIRIRKRFGKFRPGNWTGRVLLFAEASRSIANIKFIFTHVFIYVGHGHGKLPPELCFSV